MATTPALVRASNPLVRWLLRIGTPMGPNTLMTVLGRRTGVPRTAPVAIAEIDGRLYVIGAYGEVNWVRNLRAAGVADVRIDDQLVPVTAHELERDAAQAFFGNDLPRYVRGLPLIGRLFIRVLFGLAAPDILRNPVRAAESHPVFELERLV